MQYNGSFEKNKLDEKKELTDHVKGRFRKEFEIASETRECVSKKKKVHAKEGNELKVR